MPTNESPKPDRLTSWLDALGSPMIGFLDYFGGIARLIGLSLSWIARRFGPKRLPLGRKAIYAQIVRLGSRAIGVVMLVNFCIGLILALQMAPTLSTFGQVDKVANIIGIAVFRELGPLISAVVLTGFAGASIAAELGTMAVAEEIEALKAMALNPVRFLIVPRLLATMLSLTLLCVLGETVAVLAGWFIGVMFLDIPSGIYIQNTLDQVKSVDFLTGLAKAVVFGLLIGAIAGYNGLNVRQGAAGVGKATTQTVVHSIVWIIVADLIFTSVFYALHLT